jgi:hypothetical protein
MPGPISASRTVGAMNQPPQGGGGGDRQHPEDHRAQLFEVLDEAHDAQVAGRRARRLRRRLRRRLGRPVGGASGLIALLLQDARSSSMNWLTSRKLR